MPSHYNPDEFSQLHKTISKSFAMQRKTLVRVLGLEGRVSELELQQAAEDQAKEGIDEILNDIHGKKEKEVGGTKTKTKPKAKAKPKAKPKVKPKAKKTRVTGKRISKPKIDADKFKRGTSQETVEERLKRQARNKQETVEGEEHKKTDEFTETTTGTDPKTGEPLSSEERKKRFKAAQFIPKTGMDHKGLEPDTPAKMGDDDNNKDKIVTFLNGNVKDNLDDVRDDLKQIQGLLNDQNKSADDQYEEMRQGILAAKKKKREEKLEADKDKKPGGGLKDKMLDAVTKPAGNIFSKIIRFVTVTFLGSVVKNIVAILKDPSRLLDPIRKFFNIFIGMFNSVMKGLWDITGAPINFVLEGVNAGVKGIIDGINSVSSLLLLPKIDPPKIPLIPGPPQVPMIPLSKTAQGAKNEGDTGAVGMSGGGLVPGPQGASGMNGKDGIVMDGRNGKDGIAMDGRNGKDGIAMDGRNGKDGIVMNAKDGKDGKDGIVMNAKDGKDGIAMAGGGLVPGYEGGAQVLGEHSIQRTEDGGVLTMSTTGGLSDGGLDETKTSTYKRTFTDIDGNEITFEEKQKMREQIASIGVPDLLEHQDQLLSEIHKLEGYENVTIDQVINQQTGIPQKKLLPILLRSDAQKATSDKQDKAHQEDMKARGIKPGQGWNINANDEVGRSLAGTIGYRTGQINPDQLTMSSTTFDSSSQESFKTSESNSLSDLSKSINVSAKDDGTRNIGQTLFSKTKGFSGGGVVPYNNPFVLGTGHNVINTAPGNIVGYNKGGKVPGSGNGDTVPAMLTPGEFVMSKGAVNMIGADKLMAMNKAGGGTNVPKMMKFAGGGIVPGIDPPARKKGKVTYMKVGGAKSSPMMSGGGGSDEGSVNFPSTDPNNVTIPVIKSLYNMVG